MSAEKELLLGLAITAALVALNWIGLTVLR